MNHAIQEILLTCAIGVTVLIVFYAAVRIRVGKSPDARDVAQTSEVPDGLSPAAIRYIYNLGEGDQITGVIPNLINLAVKGRLRIVEEGGLFSIVQNHDTTCTLSVDEKTTADSLLGNNDRVALFPSRLIKKSNNARISLYSLFSGAYKAAYFPDGSFVRFISWLIAVFTTILTINPLWSLGLSDKSLKGVMVWLGISILALLSWVTVAGSLYEIWHRKKIGGSSLGSSNALLIFAFLAALVLTLFSSMTYPHWVPSQVPLWIVPLVLLPWVIRYQLGTRIRVISPVGRMAVARILSFREYLTGAKRAPRVDPGDLSCFEKHLPYAIALDVSAEWAHRFSSSRPASEIYNPTWYKGSSLVIKGPSDLASVLSESFVSAVGVAGSSGASPAAP